MTDEERTQQFLQRHEGRRAKPYRCPSGFWTIGIGRNLETNPLTLTELIACLGNGIPEDAIDLLAFNDRDQARQDLRLLFVSFDGWPPARQAALISVYFTLGFDGLRKFKKFITALKMGDWNQAATELLDSKRSRETLKNSPRDEEEAEMIRKGDWL